MVNVGAGYSVIFLVVMGLWWCKEMFERFPKDVAQLRGNEDVTNKGVIALFWVLTLGVVAFLVNFCVSVIYLLFDLH